MSLIFRYGLPLTLAALAGLASSASAQIVKDGGFEDAAVSATRQTSYFTAGSPFDANWAVGGEVGIDNKDGYAYAGSNSLYLNYGTFGIDSIAQNVKTDPTMFYTLSFYADDDTPGNILQVAFGGNTVAYTAVPANGFGGSDAANKSLYTLYTFSGLTVKGPFSGLSFSSDGTTANGGVLELDGITLTSSPVPEASTSLSLGLLLMLGLGGAAWTAKKKSAAKAASSAA